MAGDKGKDVVEMLDRDHQLLPRDTDPPLEEEIIEVWNNGNLCNTLYIQFLPL